MIGKVAERAEARLREDAAALAPVAAERVFAWVDDRFGRVPLARLFTDLHAFPVVSLPWWLEETVGRPDPDLQVNLAASSMAGYLWIRLVDDVADGDVPTDVGLLPALAPLGTLFVRPYRRLFPAGHPFWSDFEAGWVGSAEAALREAGLGSMDAGHFAVVAARKTGAARIPMAAVCHMRDRVDLLGAWLRFLDAFAGWHQMRNDVRGWRRDLAAGAVTYFLSEGSRRGGDVEGWVLREGLAWGLDEMARRLEEARGAARPLGSPGLDRHLDRLARALDEDRTRAGRGLASARALAAALAPAPGPDRR